MPKSLPKSRYKGSLGDQVRAGYRTLLQLLANSMVYLLSNILGRQMKRSFESKKGRGETIWLDDLYFGNRDTPEHHPHPAEAADLTPNSSVKSRKSRIMKAERYPEPVYPFKFRRPPLSGNIINGLGERKKRRPRIVFHTGSYAGIWGGMERYFHTMADMSSLSSVLKIRWDNRRRSGPTFPVQRPVDDPQEMSAVIKAAAMEIGAVLVGITTLRDEFIFDHAQLSYPYAISIAVIMDRAEMVHAPSSRSSFAVQAGYRKAGQIAIDLAERIRAIGWEARAATNLSQDTSEVLHLPIAIDAGLGQLGKHGSLITRDFGSNVRLATVLTDLPLAVDTPVDIGVDDFCASCQICVTNCPPHAIFDTKQWVRGEERWYVDFDCCVPYFSENHGCGICIEVCPWSEPGRGISIMEKMLARREPDLMTISTR